MPKWFHRHWRVFWAMHIFQDLFFHRRCWGKKKRAKLVYSIYGLLLDYCPEDRKVRNKMGLTTGCHSRLKPCYIICVSGRRKFWIFLSLCLNYSMAEASEGWLKAESAALPTNSWIILAFAGFCLSFPICKSLAKWNHTFLSLGDKGLRTNKTEELWLRSTVKILLQIHK